MTLSEFTQQTFKPGISYYFRPRIICNDGFVMSVQGSDHHYSEPRDNVAVFSEMEIGFPSEKGRGYVFPSWLTHWVPPHPDKKPRVSVAWNIILRGEYGYANDFQYAKI